MGTTHTVNIVDDSNISITTQVSNPDGSSSTTTSAPMPDLQKLLQIQTNRANRVKSRAQLDAADAIDNDIEIQINTKRGA